MDHTISNLSNEDVSTISKSHGFSGFLTASQLIHATTAVTSTGLNLDLDTQPCGNIQPSVVEILSPELARGAVALSTSLGGPADGPTQPRGGPVLSCRLHDVSSVLSSIWTKNDPPTLKQP